MLIEILKNIFSVVCLIRFQLRQEVCKGSAYWWHCTAVVSVKKCSCSLMIERETIMSSCLVPLLIFRIQVFHHHVLVLQ